MKTMIVDVREPEEFARGHVEGAINLPPAESMAGAVKLQDVPKDTPMVLYCMSGARSRASIQILEGLGFTNLKNGVNQHHVQQMIDRGEL